MALKPKNILKKTTKTFLPNSILLWLKKRYYLKALKKFQDEEEPDIIVVRKLVKDENWVADIGANHGIYTHVLSVLVGNKGKVFSFEPIKDTYDILSYGIRKRCLNNVTKYNVALSDKNGQSQMEIPLFENGTENYYQASLVRNTTTYGLRHFTVETCTLDSIAMNIEKELAFVKCDVEGHELPLIRGAKSTIKATHPAWLIEIEGNPDVHGSKAYELFNYMLLEGYHPYWFDYNNNQLKYRQPGDKSVNYFFLTEKHKAILITANLL